MNYLERVALAKREIREATTAELASDPPALLIDCREPGEFATGVIAGARLVPMGVVAETVTAEVEDLDTTIMIYCAVGNRSALAAKALKDLGYRDVSSLQGGITRWLEEGRPVAGPDGALSLDQRERYSRHLLLPEVGEEGQVRLLESRVALIGAGGLGSPAAMYLAAAGVGTLGVIDFDIVETSNLQRQLLHNLGRVGMAKTESARETIGALNPDVRVEMVNERLQASNVLDVLDGYDVVIDGADNFPTRYLVNDASMHLRMPVVHGSIFRFEGQASVFAPYEGPCYRCLYPEPPPPHLAPDCAVAGVLGVLPGIIGSIQAIEAVKVLLGLGEPLIGRLLVYDSLEQSFSTFRVVRRPACAACGDPSRPPLLVDYDELCMPAGSVARTA